MWDFSDEIAHYKKYPEDRHDLMKLRAGIDDYVVCAGEASDIEDYLREELGPGWIFPGDVDYGADPGQNKEDIRVLFDEIDNLLWLSPSPHF
jgi:hypothetical protein